MQKPRNPVARSPLLRKGGVHIKSKTGQRVRSRLSVEDAIDEWYETSENASNKVQKEREPKAPFLFVPYSKIQLFAYFFEFGNHLYTELGQN